jgi:hypothetical protein
VPSIHFEFKPRSGWPLWAPSTGNLLHRGAGSGFAKQRWGSAPVRLQDGLIAQGCSGRCQAAGAGAGALQVLPQHTHGKEAFVDLGIAPEITGDRRNRLFGYDAYLKNPSEGAEPPSELDTGNCIMICRFHRINCKCAV